jgi:hypothetical protein
LQEFDKEILTWIPFFEAYIVVPYIQSSSWIKGKFSEVRPFGLSEQKSAKIRLHIFPGRSSFSAAPFELCGRTSGETGKNENSFLFLCTVVLPPTA